VSRRALIALAALALLLGVLAWLLHEREPETAPEQLARARKLAGLIGTVPPAGRAAAFDATVSAYDKVGAFPDAEGAHEAALREALDLLLREGRRDAALERVRRLLSRTPPPEDGPALLLRVAESREEAAEYPLARELYDAVARSVTKTAELSAEAAYRAAVILHDRMPEIARGDVIERWRAFVGDYPKSKRVPDALLRLAELYRSIGEKELAIATYRKIVDEHGDSDAAAKALREIGIIYGEELGKPKEAAKAFEQLEEEYGDTAAGSGARAMREKAEKEASAEEEEEYREGHYGGGVPDITDLIARTPREEMAELIAMKLDVRRLDLDVSLAPEEGRIAAAAALAIAHEGSAPRTDLALVLAPGLEVGAARFGEEECFVKLEAGVVRVAFETPWPPGEERLLTLSYRGAGRVMGLRLEADGFAVGSAGAVPTGVVGDIYRCRARFRVPRGFSVVASGARLDPEAPLEPPLPGAPAASTRTADPAEGEDAFVFSTGEDPIFALYFAWGRFQAKDASWRGRPLGVRWLTKEFDGADRMLADLADILDFYSERFGEPPWPAFTIVEASVHEMGAAGIGPACMLLLAPHAFAKDAKEVRNLMAHELAHQWWGNAVPVTLAEGWAPWLSEGMATYADALYFEKREGRLAARRHLTKYAHLYYDQMLVFGDRPLSDAWASAPAYRSIAYEKGARVLHMLRRACGDDAFFAGIQKYHRDFRFRSSGIDDLRRSLEATSALDLAPFFEDWVQRPGFPRFSVRDVTATARPSGGFDVEVAVAQEGTVFRVPRIDVRLEASDGRAETVSAAVLGAETRLAATLPYAPARVVLDPDDDVLKLPGRDTEWTREIAALRARRRGGGEVGKPAPAASFSLEDGATLALDARRGAVVAVVFYSSAAKPCRAALADLTALRAELAPRGLQVVAVSREPFEEQRSFARRFAIDVPLARAEDDAYDLFGGVKSVPTLFVLDRDGVVRARRVGLRSREDMRADIEPHLLPPPPVPSPSPSASPTPSAAPR
jgi:peroxiredoxin/tetratricopeptide (TPR) repeat protein